MSLLKELVLSWNRKLIKLLMNLNKILKVDIDYWLIKGSMILSPWERYIIKLIMLIMCRRLLMRLLLGRRIYIRGSRLLRSLRRIRIGLLLLRNLISWWRMGSFRIFPRKRWQIGHIKSYCGNCRIYQEKYSERKESQIPYNLSSNRYKMMTVYMRVRPVMARSMERVSTTSKMGIFMKARCTRVSCKEKGSTHGQTKMYMKALSFKTRWTEMGSSSLQMAMSMKVNSSTTELPETERWCLTMEMLTRVNSWATWSKEKASNSWRTAISMKASSSKANGMAVENYCSQMRQ